MCDGAGEQQHDRPEQARQAEMVEQPADEHDRHDKAERAPDADASVTSGFAAQVVESQGFDQRQGRHPEEREYRQHDEDGFKAGDEKEGGKDQQRRHAGRADDLQPLADAVGQRAPEIRAEDPHHLHLRHQDADIPGGKGQRLQIKPEIGRKPAQVGKIEKIIDGEPPVREFLHPRILLEAPLGGGRRVKPSVSKEAAKTNGVFARHKPENRRGAPFPLPPSPFPDCASW